MADNLSIFAIPTLWLISSVPHIWSMQIATPFDLRHPRTLIRDVEKDKTLSPAIKERIVRLQGAHQNGFENIAFFASAIFAGNMAGLPASTMNRFALAYLTTRVIYTAVYLVNDTREKAQIRMGLFFMGIGMIFWMFWRAGSVLMLVN